MIQWRKNQVAINISAALIFFGYTLVMPFLPSFVRELGITSKAGVAFWSGLILSCSPLIAALCGPVWGRIGDRWGLKLMAQRATIANALLWFSMGFAQNVYQLLALRAGNRGSARERNRPTRPPHLSARSGLHRPFGDDARGVAP